MSIEVSPRTYTLVLCEETMTHLHDLLWRRLSGTAISDTAPLGRLMADIAVLVSKGELNDDIVLIRGQAAIIDVI